MYYKTIKVIASASLFLFNSLVSAIGPQTLQTDGVAPICGRQTLSDENSDLESFEEFIQSVGKSDGIYSGLIPDEQKTQYLGERTYQVTENTPLDIILLLYSQETPAQAIRLLVFLDETPVLIDGLSGQDEEFGRKISLTPGEIYETTITLPPMESGVYDFFVLRIHDANNEPSLMNERDTFADRLSFIVQDSISMPSVGEPARPFVKYDPNGLKSRGDPRILLGLSLDDTLRQWNYPEASVVIGQGDTLSFNILAGDTRVPEQQDQDQIPDPSTRLALIVLMGYQPIPMVTTYAEISSDTSYSRIPIEFVPTQPAGRHELVIIRVDNPGIPLCQLYDENPNEFLLISRVQALRALVDIQ
jgi:hypothetical protein